jgi:histidine ammonia-lyase
MRLVPLRLLAAGLAGWLALAATPALAYNPITPTASDQTVTLTGKDLTIAQVVLIARHGARIALAPEARQRAADAYGLLLQAPAEDIPVYWFNRGGGPNREVVIFAGDPMTPQNKAFLEANQLAAFAAGVRSGYGPEVEDEEIVRAMMAVRANMVSFEAVSPDLIELLVQMINHRITPVVQSRGTVGEGDLPQMSNIGAAMVGKGEVYYQGVRMPAAEALQKAGLRPLQPFGADLAGFISTNAYTAGQAALLMADARHMLEWASLIYAVDLNGMNSSVTPMSMPVQSNRPLAWVNWESARILEMIRGSYLFEVDPARIIQDPESMRATPQRMGAAWKAWAMLRATVETSINFSDHNPAVRPGLTPQDSWELSTPHLMKYFIKGGPNSGGKSGYILSNASWDPYPLANEIEFFTIAVSNMAVAVAQRIDRFSNPFFTVIRPADVLTPAQLALAPTPPYDGMNAKIYSQLWHNIQGLAVPVAAGGSPINATVEDLQANTLLKVTRAREAVDDTLHLLGLDLLGGTYWLEVRKAQDPARAFGPAPTAVLAAFRQVWPWQQAPEERPAEPMGHVAYRFLKATSPSSLYRQPATLPAPEDLPIQ